MTLISPKQHMPPTLETPKLGDALLRRLKTYYWKFKKVCPSFAFLFILPLFQNLLAKFIFCQPPYICWADIILNEEKNLGEVFFIRIFLCSFSFALTFFVYFLFISVVMFLFSSVRWLTEDRVNVFFFLLIRTFRFSTKINLR